jgi:hypothetical protein
MKRWPEAIRDVALTGALASLASTAVLALRGRNEADSASAPSNATSHWVWGEKAMRHEEPSLRYTLLGYAIHHASSTLWASVYERLFGREAERGHAGKALLGGAAVATIACLVDYRLTPERLRPGFERHLSKPALFLTYATFGAALAARGLALAQLPRSGPRVPRPRVGVASVRTY